MSGKKAKQLRRKIYGDKAHLKVQDREYQVVGIEDSLNRTRSRTIESGCRGDYQAEKRRIKRDRSS